MPTPAQRRQHNQMTHWAARQESAAARGPKGVAAAWYDQARALARQQEQAGNPDAWADLARTLETWCRRYSV